MLTEAMLRTISLGRSDPRVLSAVAAALAAHGARFGLDRPHRLAHYIAQVAVESGHFSALEENLSYSAERLVKVWPARFRTLAAAKPYARNPRKLANKVYGGRMGNKGADDGWRFRGRTPKQITGRSNYRAFSGWCRKHFPGAPDFEAEPDRILEDPWCGLAGIWFWAANDLNRFADDNNIEMVTRTVNGGLNGYADRLAYYPRAALVLLGYGPKDVEPFQKAHPEAGAPDGVAGEKTRMALHRALAGANPYREVERVETPVPVEVEREVMPESVETEVRQKSNWLSWLFGAGGALTGLGTWLADADGQTIALVAGGGLVAGAAVLIGGTWIVRRIKAIRRELEA